MIRRLIILLLIVGCLFGRFPETITDIDGNNINLKELVTKKTVAVIMMRAPDCPYCYKQILRIIENFDDFDGCNETFLVLSPEPIEKLRAVKETTQFPFPFIVDNNLTIARSLDLLQSETEILPSILILNDKLEIEWSQTGRSPLYYGDTELKMHLKCYGWITKLIKKFTALFN